MSLEHRLAEKQDELAAKWAELVLCTYPKETQVVWRRNKDCFTNPVGTTIVEATANLLRLILEWENAEAISVELDRLVRVRSVQNFTASQAVGFVFLLKKLLREEFRGEGMAEELLRFEARIDNLALMAFDLHAKSREEIFNLRCQEIKNAQHTLLKRARMLVDETD